MGDQKNQDTPGFADQEQKHENERAGQNSYDKDQESNPERGKRHDPQLDPNHIQEDPARENAR